MSDNRVSMRDVRRNCVECSGGLASGVLWCRLLRRAALYSVRYGLSGSANRCQRSGLSTGRGW